MTRPKSGSWRWKVQDPANNPGLDLLYEPGNWGDVIKGAWAILVARTVLSQRSSKVFRYLDPFSGRPTYPLVDSARERLEALSHCELKTAQEPYRAQGLLGSTALLVRDAALKLGAAVEMHVFDVDPVRSALWSEIPQAIRIDCANGEEAALKWRDFRPLDLVLIDPYDLFDRPSPLVPAGLEAAVESPVLFYLYNRAPRGGGHERSYRSLRDRIDETKPGGVEVLIGRIPSDAILPRAYHEMIFAGPRELVADARPELEAVTRSLSRHLGDLGAVETA